MAKTHMVLTASEKRQLRKKFNSGMRLAIAGSGPTDEDDAEYERILQRGYQRGRAEVEAMQREVDAAQGAVVGAKTKLRIAKGDEKSAARRALRDAEAHLRTVQRAQQRLGE